MKSIETLSAEYDKAKKEYHEARDALMADPNNALLMHQFFFTRSQAKWAYKQYNPDADLTVYPFFSVRSDKMIEV